MYKLYYKSPATPKLELIVQSGDVLECFNVLPHVALALQSLPSSESNPTAEYVIWLELSTGITEVFSCKIWLPLI